MRYAILSDVHANLPALRAVLADIATQSVDATICLGDTVGYYADSLAVITLLNELLVSLPCRADGQDRLVQPWVAGNHEWGVLGWLPERMFSSAALHILQRTRTALNGQAAATLECLPQRIEIDLGSDLHATLVHASPADPVGANGASYIDNSEDARNAARSFTTSICLVGHTHCPRVCVEGQIATDGRASWHTYDVFDDVLPGGSYCFGKQRVILNPGSVGQPRDGDPRAAYAILDADTRIFCVRRVPYAVEEAQARFYAWIGEGQAARSDWHGLAERLTWGI